jgi:hypothetical protein
MQLPLSLISNEQDKLFSPAEMAANIVKLTEYFTKNEVSQQQLVGSWEQIQPFTGSVMQAEAFDWISACLKFHYEHCDLLRLDFYRIVSQGTPESLRRRLQLLSELTKDAKDFRNIEYRVGGLLGSWISFRNADLEEQLRLEILQFATKAVKYSFVFFDEASIGIILDQIQKCFSPGPISMVSLDFLDALCRFGYVPRASINSYNRIICAGIIDEGCSEATWDVFSSMIDSEMFRLLINQMLSFLYEDTERILGALLIINRLTVEDIITHIGVTNLLYSLESCNYNQDCNVCSLKFKICIQLFENVEIVDIDALASIFTQSCWVWKNHECKLKESEDPYLSFNLELISTRLK